MGWPVLRRGLLELRRTCAVLFIQTMSKYIVWRGHRNQGNHRFGKTEASQVVYVLIMGRSFLHTCLDRTTEAWQSHLKYDLLLHQGKSFLASGG